MPAACSKLFKGMSPSYKRGQKNEKRQIKELKIYVENWKGNGGNLVLVTHYSIITAITDAVPSSGEIVITDKNFNVLSTVITN